MNEEYEGSMDDEKCASKALDELIDTMAKSLIK